MDRSGDVAKETRRRIAGNRVSRVEDVTGAATIRDENSVDPVGCDPPSGGDPRRIEVPLDRHSGPEPHARIGERLGRIDRDDVGAGGEPLKENGPHGREVDHRRPRITHRREDPGGPRGDRTIVVSGCERASPGVEDLDVNENECQVSPS